MTTETVPLLVANKSPIFSQKDQCDLYLHAPEITWSAAERLWMTTNEEMRNRRKIQLIAIPSESPGTYSTAVDKLLNFDGQSDFLAAALNPVPPSVKRHPDDNIHLRMREINPETESFYAIASLKDSDDLMELLLVGDLLKSIRKKSYSTAVLTVMNQSREDKNTDELGMYQGISITARLVMDLISQCFDRLIIIEPHSSGVQAFGALSKKTLPVLPISPWKYLIDSVLKDNLLIDQQGRTIPLNSDSFVSIRPDEGRNLAALRIQNQFGLPGVGFRKKRIDGHSVAFTELEDQDYGLLAGKYGFTYDDEGSTLGTLASLADYACARGCRGLFGIFPHVKLTDEWYTNISNSHIMGLVGTDSMVPIGDIRLTNKISLISLTPFIAQIIAADIAGVNFWQPPWDKTILQPRPETSES